MDQNPNKEVRVPVDLMTEVPALFTRLGEGYQDIIFRDGENVMGAAHEGRQIYAYRLPGPATHGDGKFGEGVFIYKGIGARLRDLHRRANEVGGMLQAAQWGQDGRHQHCHIPQVYDNFTDYPTDGTAPAQPVYIASEYIFGSNYRTTNRETGCLGWTVREKRRFVRQLALFRLSMMQIRSNRIGGMTPDGALGRMPYHAIGHRSMGAELENVMDPNFYIHTDPVASEQEWCQAGVERETAYWEGTLDEGFLNYIMTRFRSVFDWNPESFLNHIQYRAQAYGTRKFRERWEELDAPSATFPFCFDHGDLHHGFNIMCHNNSPNINAIIDWETSMFLPYSFAVKDINAASLGLGDWDADLRGLREEDMPFTTDMHWDFAIAHWRTERDARAATLARRTERARRNNRRISTMNDNNYAAYGRLTVRDLMFGDTLDDTSVIVDEPADDLDPFFFEGVSEFQALDWDVLQPSTWFYGPVMKLIDEFLQNEMQVSPLCKYLDPFLELWTTAVERMVRPP